MPRPRSCGNGVGPDTSTCRLCYCMAQSRERFNFVTQELIPGPKVSQFSQSSSNFLTPCLRSNPGLWCLQPSCCSAVVLVRAAGAVCGRAVAYPAGWILRAMWVRKLRKSNSESSFSAGKRQLFVHGNPESKSPECLITRSHSPKKLRTLTAYKAVSAATLATSHNSSALQHAPTHQLRVHGGGVPPAASTVEGLDGAHHHPCTSILGVTMSQVPRMP